MIRMRGGFAANHELLIPMLTVDSYETITDLMTLQDQIDAFQKLIFSHFQSGTNNECRISALVPLVTESYGIYKFVTSMLRAMHTSKAPCAVAITNHGMTDGLQRRAMPTHWNPSADVTTPSITALSVSTTNARTCAT